MLRQSLLAIAAVGLLVATSEAQIVVEFGQSEVKKADAKKADAKHKVRVYAVQADEKDVAKTYTEWHRFAIPFFAADAGGEYWVGVQCHPVSATLRAQLGLDKDAGLVVSHVVKDGPAAKAGIKQHDILLVIGDENLANQQQLVEQIQKREGKALKFKLLRAGKEKIVELTPAERKSFAGTAEAMPSDAAIKKAFEWLKRHQATAGADGKPLTLRMLRPGVVVDADWKFSFGGEDIPKGLSVSITRTSGKPAKITVKQGDKTWDLKEGDLDELPKELRPHVKRLMGGPHAAFDMKRFKGLMPLDLDIRVEKVDPVRLRAKVLRRGAEIEGDVKKQIREMNKRLEKMQQDLRELLEKHGEE